MAKRKADLVQIEVPPHHQSLKLEMDCHVFYVTAEIKKIKIPGSIESARGNQIHHTMARYARHCKEHSVSMDLIAFEDFRQGAGPQAAKILSKLRDGYQVDYQHLIATELRMSLDAEYRPTLVHPELEKVCLFESKADPTYVGTLDSLYAYPEIFHLLIEDYKSHPKPFSPDENTIQDKEYTLFIFQHFPWAKTVTFRYVFVRYPKCVREITYSREDLPKLIEAVKASRDLQVSIHMDYAAGKPIQATPGPHCCYCPLLTPKTCPIADFVGAAQMSMEDRVRFKDWYAQFSRENTKILNAHVQATGRAVVLQDGNGRNIVYGPVDGVSNVYPLFTRNNETGGLAIRDDGQPVMPIVEHLMDHAHENPDDTDFMLKLQIGSTQLNPALNTKKRMHLDQSLQDDVFVKSNPTLKITRPAEVEEDPEDEEEESDE